MNLNKAIMLAGSVVATGIIAQDYIKSRVQTRKKIKKIDAETEAEIAAIAAAARRVRLGIEFGEYRDKTLEDVRNDFSFYRMTERFED